ncbi:alpha/beta fold hydrolase [Holdemania filiformis]|uniref:alpha/beta fold hydrolase n=1 Tax=Holdemania filiformis TaxID=61171 RepID=UPI002676160F|nr:alpha/beta hydrolase [Holdemania filiformis]
MKLSTKCLLTTFGAAAAAGTAYAVQRRVNQRNQRFDQDTGFELKEYRMINGIQQYLVHRTENDENPVLLVLHGGPGESAMPTRYLYQREWEKYFTVVNWDQRLCGKTLQINADQKEELASSLTLDQLIEDTREICDVLRAQYHQDKIFILGHSWGSVLGTMFVRKYPDRVKAYVGVGQVVSMRRNEETGYQKVLQKARIAGADHDVQRLLALTPYPQTQFDQEMMDKMMVVRRLQRKYHLAAPISLKALWQMLAAPDVNPGEFSVYFNLDFKLQLPLLQELMGFDLEALDRHYEVPVYYLLGDQDWQTPYPIAQEYFAEIEAPRKQLILIPNAGHNTMIDQPEFFLNALRAVLLA